MTRTIAALSPLSVAAQRYPCSSVLRSVAGPKECRSLRELSAGTWSSADAVDRNTDEHGYPRMNTDGIGSVAAAQEARHAG